MHGPPYTYIPIYIYIILMIIIIIISETRYASDRQTMTPCSQQIALTLAAAGRLPPNVMLSQPHGRSGGSYILSARPPPTYLRCYRAPCLGFGRRKNRLYKKIIIIRAAVPVRSKMGLLLLFFFPSLLLLFTTSRRNIYI